MADIYGSSDDIFDENADETVIERNHWEKLHSARIKEGFRDGVTYGEESVMQVGFNDGFVQTMSIFHHLTKMRGFLCGITVLQKMKKDCDVATTLVDKLEAIIQLLTDKEQEWLKTCGTPRSIPVSITKEFENQSNVFPKGSEDGSSNCRSDSPGVSCDCDKFTPGDSTVRSHKCEGFENKLESMKANSITEFDHRLQELQRFEIEIKNLLQQYGMGENPME